MLAKGQNFKCASLCFRYLWWCLSLQFLQQVHWCLMARLVQLEFIRYLSLATLLHTVLCCEAVRKTEWNL